MQLCKYITLMTLERLGITIQKKHLFQGDQGKAHFWAYIINIFFPHFFAKKWWIPFSQRKPT